MPTFANKFDLMAESLAVADDQVYAFIGDTVAGVDAADGTITEGEFKIRLNINVTDADGNDRVCTFSCKVVESADFEAKLNSDVSHFFLAAHDVVSTWSNGTPGSIEGKVRIGAKYS